MHNVYCTSIETKFIISRRPHKFDHGPVGWGWTRPSGGPTPAHPPVRRGGAGPSRC